MKTVLVVDDEDVLRNLYAEILSEEGYIVFKASSGEDALKKIEKISFQLVVTDLNMPGMSGLDLLQKIKEYKKEIQVILLTSHADIKLAGNASQLGLFWYLVKPLDDLKELVSKVTAAIGLP